ncbi:MAG: hypothetical protein ACXVWX_07745 [Nocardioides sp.]
MARVAGQNRSAQRMLIPPWLWPRIAIRRPVVACIRLIAKTRYSAAVWMSPKV